MGESSKSKERHELASGPGSQAQAGGDRVCPVRLTQMWSQSTNTVTPSHKQKPGGPWGALGGLGHQRPHTLSLKQPPRQVPPTAPPNCGPRGRGIFLPTRTRVMPTVAISMATNNKHPGNHSGTGSDSHMTGRLFFFSVRRVKIVRSPWEISCPLSFPQLELERRGVARRVATPPPQCARLVAGVTGPPSTPAIHGSRLGPPSLHFLP